LLGFDLDALQAALAAGEVQGEPLPLYYSREAAEALGDPGLAPKLLVIYNE
jgi:hypothetical protein